MSPRSSRFSLSHRAILIWVVCLAALSVGARNFEDGITLDGPFYASIARNILRSGNWFTLNSGIPDLNPFYGNPHLGFWVFALWLKILPAADWALRIVGHLYYVAFLSLFFLYVRRKSSEKIAVVSVILLWSWFQFSNPHSNVYLDPGALFWGALSVFLWDRDRPNPSAGVALGLCALYKSMTFVGFLPALALITFQRRAWRRAVLALLAFITPVGLYALALRSSPEPDFLAKYWSVQITHRFARIWSVANLFAFEYWRQFLYYSYYLAPLGLIAFRKQTRSEAVIPTVMAVPFIVIYSVSGLIGGQYLIMVLPWIAWLIALGVAEKIRVPSEKLVWGSQVIAVGLLCLAQFLPFSTHGRGLPDELDELRALSRRKEVERLYFDFPVVDTSEKWSTRSLSAATAAWYGDVTIEYPDVNRFPRAEKGAAYLLVNPLDRSAIRPPLGWCRGRGNYRDASLWLPCLTYDLI
ncbi:MAG: glycosyltransferase family 39 protein, partial [Deltaproteobacteria bacterium]|nr:glycosyltransferase family 39 protein [Deltaproteobacteria bacterium]